MILALEETLRRQHAGSSDQRVFEQWVKVQADKGNVFAIAYLTHPINKEGKPSGVNK